MNNLIPKSLLGLLVLVGALPLGADAPKDTSTDKPNFIMPSLDRKLHEVAFLMTHNGYSSFDRGFVYANQKPDLAHQISDYGARSTELDTYHRCWSKGLGIFGGSGCTVSLCHGSCDITKFLQPGKGFGAGLVEKSGDPDGFRVDGLNVIKKFLQENPKEVFILFLENYDHDYKYLDKQLEDAQITDLILKPSDWNPFEKKGWPTLQWMVDNNKRLVVANNSSPAEMKYNDPKLPFASTPYMYHRWQIGLETNYGELDMVKAAAQRSASAKYNYLTRYFYTLDYFGPGGKILGNISDLIKKAASLFKVETPFGGDFSKVNGPDLRKFLDYVLTNGIDNGTYKGRYPNFFQLDFINEGDPLPITLVNQINQMANDPDKRKVMFRALTPGGVPEEIAYIAPSGFRQMGPPDDKTFLSLGYVPADDFIKAHPTLTTVAGKYQNIETKEIKSFPAGQQIPTAEWSFVGSDADAKARAAYDALPAWQQVAARIAGKLPSGEALPKGISALPKDITQGTRVSTGAIYTDIATGKQQAITLGQPVPNDFVELSTGGLYATPEGKQQQVVAGDPVPAGWKRPTINSPGASYINPDTKTTQYVAAGQQVPAYWEQVSTGGHYKKGDAEHTIPAGQSVPTGWLEVKPQNNQEPTGTKQATTGTDSQRALFS